MAYATIADDAWDDLRQDALLSSSSSSRRRNILCLCLVVTGVVVARLWLGLPTNTADRVLDLEGEQAPDNMGIRLVISLYWAVVLLGTSHHTNPAKIAIQRATKRR